MSVHTAGFGMIFYLPGTYLITIQLFPADGLRWLWIFTARRVYLVRTMPWQDVCRSICHTPILCLRHTDIVSLKY